MSLSSPMVLKTIYTRWFPNLFLLLTALLSDLFFICIPTSSLSFALWCLRGISIKLSPTPIFSVNDTFTQTVTQVEDLGAIQIIPLTLFHTTQAINICSNTSWIRRKAIRVENQITVFNTEIIRSVLVIKGIVNNIKSSPQTNLEHIHFSPYPLLSL